MYIYVYVCIYIYVYPGVSHLDLMTSHFIPFIPLIVHSKDMFASRISIARYVRKILRQKKRRPPYSTRLVDDDDFAGKSRDFCNYDGLLYITMNIFP